MKKNFKLHFILMTAVAAALGACAPKVEEKVWPQARTQFGPLKTDRDLSNEKLPAAMAISWHDDASAASIFRVTENFQFISENSNQPALKDTAQKMTKAVIKSIPQNSNRKYFIDSDYVELMVKETADTAEKTLNELLTELKNNRKAIADLLEKDGRSFQLEKSSAIQKDRDQSLKFVEDFLIHLSALKLHPAVKKTLQTAIYQELERLRKVSQETIEKINQAKTLTLTLTALNDLLAGEKIELSGETQKLLQDGIQLGKTVDSMNDAQSILAVLVDIWNRLTPDERNQYIKSNSQDLYDYLKVQDATELVCLQKRECNDFLKIIPKKVIFSKLNSKNIEEIRTTINLTAKERALEEIQGALVEKLSPIPRLLMENIDSKLEPEVAKLRKLHDQFNSQLKERLGKWAQKSLSPEEAQPFELSASSARVDITNRVLQLDWASNKTASLENSGALLSLLTTAWESQSLTKSTTASTQIYGINQISRAWLHPEELPQTMKAADHAEGLRGLIRLFTYFRDWEVNQFDSELGARNAQELFPEYEATELDRPIFPKQALMALSLSYFGNVLQSITKENSQVFVVDLDQKITWADQFNFNSRTQAVMAGIVDRVDTKRAKIVYSEDISRYLLALTDFLRATEAIQNSKSEYLQKVMPSGKTGMTMVIEARGKIRLLILALSNYLSHQFKAGGDFVVPALNIDTQMPPSNQEVRIVDQALAIRALTESSQVLGISLYDWEAQDLYFALNQKLFNTKTGFYGAKEVDLPTMLETLRALHTLKKSRISTNSRGQIDTLMNYWLKNLAGLNLK